MKSKVRSLSLRLGLLLSAIFLAASSGFAQSDSSQITGNVHDASGASIPGAKVTARNEGTGTERQTTTTGEGFYTITNLQPGYYTVSVEAAGFKKYIKKTNKLDASIPLSVEISLEVGAVSESIEVTASTASVQADSATVGKTIEAKQIENMAMNGRNPLLLAQLKPGVQGDAMNRFTFGLNNGLQINGARSQDFLITFDGAVGVRTRSNGTSVGTADVDTVQEVQVLTSNYNAEYGRTSGGQVRIVTKSGGRDLHVTAYEYLRNRELDANTWLRNTTGARKPQNTFNQFGFVVNGPIMVPKVFNTDRSRAFFSFSQEYVRYRQEVTATTTVPTPLMRTGNFSELLSPNPFFAVRTINDPTTGAPFPGNIIPANRVSSNGLALLRAYPDALPGYLSGRNNYFASRSQPENQRKDNLGIDLLPTSNQTIRARWSNYTYHILNGFNNNTDRATTDQSRPNVTGSINHVWTINPTTVNEFLVAASVDRVYTKVNQSTGAYKRSAYGINYPYLFGGAKEIQDKIPTIEINSFGTVDGGPYPSQSTGPIYQISNNTTKIIRNHTLKFGFYFERSGQNDFDQINVSGVPGGTNNQNGRFVFSDGRQGAPNSGLAIANAALGLFDTYAEIGTRAYTPYRGQMYEAFFQDSWKINSKLRIEMGLRYTIMQPYYYSLWNNIAVFDPSKYDPAKAVVLDRATGNVLSGDRYNGIVIPGTGWPKAAIGRVPIASDPSFNRLFSGGSNTFGQLQKNNWAPRFGIAYSINTKTVVRAGGGSFFQRPGVSDGVFLGGQAPFQPFASVTAGNVDNPGGTAGTQFPFYYMTTDPVFKIPRSYQWNTTVEREVGFSTIVTAAYVGRTANNLERTRNLNQLQPGTTQANPGANVNFLRPYKGFAQIDLQENAARSTYHSFQLEANRRFSKGFLVGAAYTLSKSMDNASGRKDLLWNAYNDKNFWGASSFDNRHMFQINFVYELPFYRTSGNAVARMVLGGWQTSGNYQWQTGKPFSITTGDDFAGTGTGTQPWEITSAASYPRQFAQGSADPAKWIQVTAAKPVAGTFSTTQNRNMFYNPGFNNFNMSAFKNFRFQERHNVQLRAEFFNLPNHPNWSGVDTNPNNATFGKVTQKTQTAPRNIQLALRYTF
ncbi:TonB-dependent receptor [Bryobacter aggregatus]|uniref:TonB-dependent receptor n=1 Tax=Bryobacter aggregatus TaxID=360054 RepID=UPI0004E1A4EB|nr:carboxypeptidase regulatory-like domain-containing protein [Bryobacter aggregatus]